MALVENKTKKYMKQLVLLVSYVTENFWTKKILKVHVTYRMINAEKYVLELLFKVQFINMNTGEKSFFVMIWPISYLTSDSLHSAQHSIYSFKEYFTPWCLPGIMIDQMLIIKLCSLTFIRVIFKVTIVSCYKSTL